jgi:hypothetical protein
MASAFNLTAQINLRGPTNLKPIIANIKRQINGANIKLNLDVNSASAKNITGITQRLNSLSKAAINANNNVGNLNTTLSSLGGTFGSLSSALNTNTNAVTKTAASISSAGKSVTQTTTAIQEFGKQSGLAVKRFAAFSSVTTVVFSLVNAISSASSEFVNFNKEIVRLSQVTGRSTADLGDITTEITRLSSGLGVASRDLLTVATTLAQAGLSAEDTKIALEALAESALSPSFDNLTNTTEGAIAAFRQFGLQSTDLKSALGSINSVAAAFAVESGDIITAIQRAGSAFASSSRGVSEGKDALNEFVAVFTSVRATTRESAETIATGLRTIFTRIQRGKTIDLLKQYGVELRDLEGKFVGPFEATKRLAAGLSSIDPRSAQFAAIAEELGGFRQINKVIPLLQQFAVAEQALSVAQKGAGSTAKDAQTAQQSLAVQFTKTRESFVSLIREVGDSGTFKAFVGLSLTLTNGFINLARSLKPLLPLLLTFASIKAGGAIKEFVGGFQIPFGGGGSGGATGGSGGGTGGTGGSGGGSGGGSSTKANTAAAIIANTTILNTNTQILTTLNQSILALNQSILNRPSPPGFASGGLVPGSGNRDTVRASLTPGEFVIRKKAVESIGIDNLAKMNKGGKASEKKSRAYVFDLDDTLLESDAKVREGTSDPFVDFKGQRAGEFIKTARATRYADMAKKRALEGYDIHVLTARPDEPETLDAIQEFMLRSTGSRATSIMGVGNISESMGGTANAKALQLTKLKELYDKIVFFDDDLENVSKARSVEGVKSRIARKNNGGIIQKFNRGSTGTGVKELTEEEENLLNRLRGAGIPRGNFGTLSAKQLFGLKSSQSSNFDVFSTQTGIQKSILQKLWETGKEREQSGKQATSQQAEEKRLIELQRKQEALINNKVLDFGLVGLRYGSGKSDTTNTFSIPKPPGFETNIENIRNLPESDQLVRVLSSTVSEKAGADTAQNMQDLLMSKFRESVKSVSSILGSKIGTGISLDDQLIDQAINNSDFFNVIGAGLEASIGSLGSPIIPKAEGSKSIDFPQGLGAKTAGFFEIPENIPTDITRTIGGEGKNLGASGYLGQIKRWLASDQGNRYLTETRGFALGGSVGSEQDTVPALLTPGEFVFNKKAAKRIGYGNLNRLNKADKVQGFNKGGPVGYASGGLVDSIGGTAGGIAAVVAILLPEVQKLAGSFSQLQGETASYAAALSGATREASSLALSTGIALKTIGASQKVTGLTVAGATIAGGISGALTDGTGKALERALLKNVEIFSKFDKNLQDISNAPTEELKLESFDRLEKSFFALDLAVSSAKTNIDFLENSKRAGESLNNLTLATVTSITAYNALSSAVESARKAVAAANTFTGTGAFGRNTAGPAVGGATKLFAKFGTFIPYVGLAITAFSLLTEGMKLFGTSLTKNNEQLDRLFNALDETTKNSKDFTLVNKNFVDKVLPAFATARTSAGGDRNKLLSSLGDIKTGDNINELNLTFRTLLKSKLATEGLRLADDQSIKDFRKGLGADADLFNKAFQEASTGFRERQFLRAQEAGGVSPEVAQAEYKRLLERGERGNEIINSVVSEYVGAKNLEILALRELTKANNSVKINLASLDNVLISLNSQLQLTLDNTINKFDDLDKKISIIGGQAQPSGGEFLRRNLSIINNLQAASPDQVASVTKNVANLLNIQGADQTSRDLFKDLSDQVESQRVLQQEFPFVLQEIAKSPTGIADAPDIIRERLTKPLTNIVGEGPESAEVVDKLLREISSGLQSALGKGEAVTNLDEFGRKNEAVAALLKQGEPSIKAYSTAIENAAKVQDKVAEQNKRIIDIQNSLTQSLIDRRKNEIQSNLDLNRTLGQDISLKELNSVFESEIKALTQNIGGQLPQQGTTNVASIAAEIRTRNASIKSLEENIRTNSSDIESSKQLSDKQLQEILIVNRLTKALQILSTSADGTKNALDKIAEAQNLFKSREETLLELIEGAKNPETAAQQQLIIQAIQAVDRGRSSSAQRTLVAKEGLRFVAATRTNEQAQKFRSKLLDQSVNATTPRNIQEAIAKAFAQTFLRSRTTVGPQEEFKTAVEQRSAASEALEGMGEKQIGVITEDTGTILNSFNQELTNVFPGIIRNFERIEAEIQTISQQNTSRQKPKEFVAPPGFATEFRNILNGITKEEVRTFSAGTGGVSFMRVNEQVLKPGDMQDIMSILGSQGPIAALKAVDDILASRMPSIPLDQRQMIEALKNLEALEKRTMRQFDALQLEGQQDPSMKSYKLPRGEDSFRPTNPFGTPPNINRIQNRPSPIDSGTMLQFNSTVGRLATVFEGSNKPIQNLSESIGSFSTTATQLTAALKDFANKFESGMKGQISYSGDVNLNFNDSLDVNIPNNNRNSTLISDLEPRLKGIITNSVAKGFEVARNG